MLLAGSQAAGEDLRQAALERLMRSWGRVHGDKERYLRKSMYHLAIDQWRRRKRRPEVYVDHDLPGQPDPTATYDLRDELSPALAQLPPRQRAVLVLRYWEPVSEVRLAASMRRAAGGMELPAMSSTAPGVDMAVAALSGWELALPGSLAPLPPA